MGPAPRILAATSFRPPTWNRSRAWTSAAPLAARGLSKRFESLVALDDLDLDLRPGAVHALIGPNGSGKTTALRALSGELRPDSGSIALGDDRLEAATQRERARRGVVGTQQTTATFPDLTVLEHTLVGAGLRRRRSGPFRTLFRTPKARAEEAEAERQALGALDLVGLLEDRGRPAAELSAHGQRLLMLASALATQPRVLLLDEPAAGASSIELDRLVDLLEGAAEQRARAPAHRAQPPFRPPGRRRGDRARSRQADRVRNPRRGRRERGRACRLPRAASPSSYDAQSVDPDAHPDRPLLLAAACGGDKSKGKDKTLLIAVNAPFSRTPYVGETIADGAGLAAANRS